LVWLFTAPKDIQEVKNSCLKAKEDMVRLSYEVVTDGAEAQGGSET
jgi:hypothetical protein